jgi:hypothetical protein
MFTEQDGLRFLANKAKIKQLEAENEELLRQASVREAEPGIYTEGKIVVEVSRNARFDPTLATKKFPLGENGENMHLYSAQVDSALAKKFLAPDQYAEVQKVYPNNRVEVRISE